VPLQGGMPIVYGGHAAGAVGVSGASSAEEDQELSVLAAEAASAAARDGGGKAATHFPAESVAAKFATGGLLQDTSRYKIDAGRRTAPGEVEYHEHVADIMHVVSGTATVATGGQMIAPHTVGPGEMRAAALDGGRQHELGEGDVLVIPPGVPHHFAAVSDPFLYLVAKVRD
jgi:mannose-6-phosphate isomerase-like protein (cupin superfamily)